MMTCNMGKGTPTSALEVILDVPPIDLFLKAEAKKAGYRLIGTSDDMTRWQKTDTLKRGLTNLRLSKYQPNKGTTLGKREYGLKSMISTELERATIYTRVSGAIRMEARLVMEPAQVYA